MFCPKCGKEAAAGARFCENCGTALPADPAQPGSAPQNGNGAPNGTQYTYAPQPTYYPPAPAYALPLKNAGLAAVIALIIPGAGHMYAGQVTTGILYLILGIVLWFVGAFVAVLTFGLGLLIPVVFWIWQIYDAYNKTNEYNAAVQQTGRAPW